MNENGIPVTYALYPDEGHGFARPENNLSFMAITEAFLSRTLGGRLEPIGEAFNGSSVRTPTVETKSPDWMALWLTQSDLGRTLESEIEPTQTNLEKQI